MRAYALIPLVLATSACQNSGGASRQTPSDIKAGVVVMFVANFVDTDQNQFLDTTVATAYVHAASGAYPIPMRARGSFAFELQTPKGQIVKEWVFDERQTAAAMRDLAPGPGFVFDLSLLGADRLQETEVEVVCTFRPTSGAPVRARRSAPVAIGPTTRLGG